MLNSFSFAQSPNIIFGVGKISLLPNQVKQFGKKVLLITGSSSFTTSEYLPLLQQSFEENNITCYVYSISREPSPQVIDEAVSSFKENEIDVVVAIGGGSVLDAGKAISAMLPLNESVKVYLEGVGTGKGHSGLKIPFIAVPTTSGTGSEATKNAVLSEIGTYGFKKSLRHNNFVPNVAIVDPLLTLNCPRNITASSGMDAFTQLLESYLSTNSTDITDALAYSGLQKVKDHLLESVFNGQKIEARIGMAYGSMISGITLANAGLGTVHGFASSIGGYFDVPHGVLCGTLMGIANRVTIKKVFKESVGWAIDKYSEVGKLFSGAEGKTNAYYIEYILSLIDEYTEKLELPKLSEFGISQDDFPRIIAETENKNNPVKLDKEELWEILENRL